MLAIVFFFCIRSCYLFTLKTYGNDFISHAAVELKAKRDAAYKYFDL